MTRRPVGLILLAAVVLVVAVVGNARPHRLAGVAQARDVAGPPAVGDCVIEPLVPASPDDVSPALVIGASVPPTYAQQQIRPCAGERYGEVVAVITRPQPATVQDAGGGATYLADPNWQTCEPRSEAYLGIGSASGGWRPPLLTASAMAGPSTLQRAAGQHWAACIAAPQFSRDAVSGPVSAQLGYATTIRDAVHTGSQRDFLGNCLADLKHPIGVTSVSCSRPHGAEVLAYGDSGSTMVPRSQLEQRCRQAIRDAAGIPDPTAAGALSTWMLVQFGSSTNVTGSPIPADSSVICGIRTTGNRKLAGSLLALGGRPLPWA